MTSPRLHLSALALAAVAASGCAYSGAGGRPAGDAPLVEDGVTDHTRRASTVVRYDPEEAMEALEDLLVGRWVGEGLGGEVEETWNPVFGDRMLGTFRLVQGGALNFSEHMHLGIEGGAVVLRLKHFGPDLVPWEDAEETTSFRLVAFDEATAWFGGLTFHRSRERLDVFLAMRRGSEVGEVAFRLQRAPAHR